MSDTPALNIPIRADLQDFRKQMTETTVLAANAARTVSATAIKMSAGFLAAHGAAGTAVLTLGRMLGFLRPIALGVTAIVDSYMFLRNAVELAGAQIEKFNQIAAQAGSAGVGTDFYQRFTQAAPKAVLSIDQVSEALKTFNQAATEQLGGSTIQARIDELVKAGNFAGNSGVGQFAGSSTTETRLRAIVSLIDQAMQKGERLAAVDLAGKAFGEPVAAALRADSGFLDQMLAKADAISKAKIVSEDDIGRAIQLRDEIDKAQQILADKWKPIESDMAELGMTARENWASVVTVFAELVGLGDRLYATLKQIPDLFASLGSSPFWTRLVEITGALGLNSTPAGLETGKVDLGRLDATNRLRAGLMNPNNVRQAMEQTENAAYGARKDTSKDPSNQGGDKTDAVDRAIDSLRKHTAQTEADTKAVGLGDAALARFKAQAQETAAVQANGGKETAAQAQAFKELQDRAAAAADALAKAKINSQISFDRQTAFLTPEDAAIASQLKDIYGSDIPRALNSTEAAAIRMNSALKGVGDAFSQSLNGPLLAFESGTRSAGVAMRQFEYQFVQSLLSMMNQYLIIRPMLSGLGSLFGFTGTSTAAAPAASPFPGFASGTDSAPGGIALVGEQGPELVHLPKGAAVYPAQVTKRLLDVPAFANGGIVGSPGAAAPLLGNSISIGDIHVHGGVTNGTPAQNRELAAQIAQQVQHSVRSMIGAELRTQMRPGGVLAR